MVAFVIGHPNHIHFLPDINDNSLYGDPSVRLMDVLPKYPCAAEVLGSDGVAKFLKNPEQLSLISYRCIGSLITPTSSIYSRAIKRKAQNLIKSTPCLL